MDEFGFSVFLIGLDVVWGKGKVFQHGDLLQLNERVITHGLQLSEGVISQGPLQTGDGG
jgi:hypothetical protein